ncbi:MAG TPA: hypothetical protein PKD09_17880 [Aggregatilinea sp.]|uniref:hypothetical protein n=1 Tax=Aggregatilinea sp. TaxID=2806333 RepID=UPI002CE096A3|nr:hypothetical protein [Aggregatilinea sp.]HML23531.1 hypothetical protein [Aggregatilinea sp.]
MKDLRSAFIRMTVALVIGVMLIVTYFTFTKVEAQGPETPTSPALDSGRYVISGVVIYDKETGTEYVLRFGWGALAPSPTPTDAPTATPTAPDTSVPAATSTPSPTASAEATITPSATLTPTATPTATATATWTLTPVPTVTASSVPVTPVQSPSSTPVPICSVIVVTSPSLRLRSDHSTAATLLAVAPTGSTWRIYEVWPMDPDASPDEWVRVQLADGRAAWMAATYSGEVYAAFEDTLDCDVLRWGPGKDEPTSTSRPTSTPAATDAPGTTALPDVTPTPESGITPAPTSATTKSCTVTLLENSMIRSGPGEAYAATGSAYAGDPLAIVAATIGGNYVWGQHGRGWTALYTRSASAWRVGVWGSEGEICLDVPGWTAAGLGVPGLIGAVGWHVTIPDIDYNDLAASLDVLAAKGYTPVVKAVEDTRSVQEAIARGGIGVWRTTRAGDCADMDVDPKLAAWLRLVGQGPYLPPPEAVTWLEVDNECPQYFQDLTWTDTYQAEMIRLFSERGYKVIVGTQPPGWYEQHQVNKLSLTWAAARQHGACLGYHAYGVTKGLRVADTDIWTGYRHRQIRAWLDALGYGDVPICATEVGTGDGRDAFDASDFATWNAATELDGLQFTAWWTAGRWGGMTANGQMALAARQLP